MRQLWQSELLFFGRYTSHFQFNTHLPCFSTAAGKISFTAFICNIRTFSLLMLHLMYSMQLNSLQGYIETLIMINFTSVQITNSHSFRLKTEQLHYWTQTTVHFDFSRKCTSQGKWKTLKCGN